MKNAFVLLASLCLLSCSSSAIGSWEEVPCKGTIKAGRYYDKNGLLSFELPDKKLDLKITELQCDRENVDVVFYYMEGYLHVTSKKLNLRPGAVIDAKAFKCIFDDTFYPAYCRMSSDAKVVYEEFIDGMYFNICEVPGAGQYANLATGKKDTAMCGTLIFQEGNLITSITADGPSSIRIMPKDNLGEMHQALKNRITDIRKTFRQELP